MEEALGFVPRPSSSTHVRDMNGLALCGAGTECTGMSAASTPRSRRVHARAPARRRGGRRASASAVLLAGMAVVRNGNVPDWERNIFDAVNGLPGGCTRCCGPSSSSA